ncbi:hypothetical protein QQX98_009221 [Neonectria punicea]|uniref:Myb-like domain-containing protein n=1 Tax=Neonectria punicea TaxID=979145 RepID=A0ABR1GT11_9HYPO
MAFKFQESLDVQSFEKRYQEKESRRAQRHVQKAQESSKHLQERLGLFRGTSPLPQACDAPVTSQAYNLDVSSPPADSGLFTIGTALNMTGSHNLPIPTTPISADGHGIVLGSEPLAWGFGTANGYVTEVDASLFDGGVARAAVVPPPEPTMIPLSTLTAEDAASWKGSRAPSETNNAVTEECSEPHLSKTSTMEVLIRARPPHEATQYASVPNYPTPSSNHSQMSEEPPKNTFARRKRVHRTACSDVEALRDTEDDDGGDFAGGIPPSKRQRDSTAISHQNNSFNREALASPPADQKPVSSRPTNQDVVRRGSLGASARVPNLHQTPAARLRARVSSSYISQPFAPTVPQKASDASAGSCIIAAAQTQACTNCGVDRAYLLRLSQNILRWADLPDNESVEASLTSGISLSPRDRETIMLRLAHGKLRDYILGSLCGDAKGPLAEESRWPQSVRAPSETAHSFFPSMDKVAQCPNADDTGSDTSDATGDTNDDSQEFDKVQIKLSKPRGRRVRWSEDEEARLQECVMKGMEWRQIATELNRSESGVQQHCRLMEQRGKPWSQLEDRRLRAYKMESMKWSEIAEKLKRPKDSVVLHWHTMPQKKET